MSETAVSSTQLYDTNPPKFSIVKYPEKVSVPKNETFTIEVVVYNSGLDGTVEVRLYDHNNNLVSSKTATITGGSQASILLSATAPSDVGNYTWTIEAYNVDTGVVDDSKQFTVEVITEVQAFLGFQFPEWIWWVMMAVIVIAVIMSLIGVFAEGEEREKE